MILNLFLSVALILLAALGILNERIAARRNVRSARAWYLVLCCIVIVCGVVALVLALIDVVSA